MEDHFIPPPWLRNRHIQSLLSSSVLRTLGANPMVEQAKAMVIDGADGSRLLGSYSAQTAPGSKGLIILIHGWEGSADSAYMLSAGRYFYNRGYDIFRLNLRDHGDSHHLNPRLFHGALLEETAQAVRRIAAMHGGGPCYLIGFSLGGNFALRIALRQSTKPIRNLRHVFAISPALDPHKATIAIDRNFGVYRRYFVNKWKRSLRKKQQLFPDRYDFSQVLKLDTCMAMTEAIMAYYPDFPSYQAYFARYTLLGDTFRDLAMPVTVIVSADDPVVPAHDFFGLTKNPLLDLSIQSYGGHCGFFTSFPGNCWYEKRIENIIKDKEGMGP